MTMMTMLKMVIMLTNDDNVLSGSSFRSSSLPDPFSREALQPAADYILVGMVMVMILSCKTSQLSQMSPSKKVAKGGKTKCV